MKASIKEIAHLLGAEIEGDSGKMIDQIAGLDQAGKGCLSFLANPKYEPQVYTTAADAVIVSSTFQPQKAISATLLRVEDPYTSFSALLDIVSHQMTPSPSPGIHPSAVIEESADLGEGVSIGAGCYVGENARIGAGTTLYPFVYIGESVEVGGNTTIHPHVAVYHGCKVGQKVRIHAGTVIGADGFGFAPQADGSFKKVPQLGIVEIQDGVEIGANTCIDRATIGKTVIEAGVKLDNLVQIAHNVKIGQSSVVAAQTGISGSTQLGKHVMVGGQAGFVGHLSIADGTKVDAQSGVNKSIKEPNQAFRGSPIQPHRQQLKSELYFRKLVEMEERIRQLEGILQQQSQPNQ